MRIKFRSKQHGLDGQFYNGDAVEFLLHISRASADIVFLDPPFNLGKVYPGRSARHDRLPENEYESGMLAVLDASIEALADGGALYLYHVPRWAMKFGAYLNTKLTFRHWIAILYEKWVRTRP